MPDLPSPQDVTEAALFSECWDAVLCYAGLCAAGPATAAQLAREAFILGVGQLRAAETCPVRGTGRRSARLPRIPLLLTAVRATATAWEAAGQGHKLDPGLRQWLHSERAARYTGPPSRRPLAVRGLRDLRQTDAELLWLAEAEAVPLPLVARRLGLDPATAADALTQAHHSFRDRCHRTHLDSPLDAECRRHARLLDTAGRLPAASLPDDLSPHLATCTRCAEAAACLRPRGGDLPGALADGVIGWGGHAYLQRRRRAAEARFGDGRPGRSAPDPDDPAAPPGRTRLTRHALLAAAVLVSLLALAASLMPFGSAEHTTVPEADPRPAVGPGLSSPSTLTDTTAEAPTGSPAPATVPPAPTLSTDGTFADPADQAAPSALPGAGTDAPGDPQAPPPEPTIARIPTGTPDDGNADPEPQGGATAAAAPMTTGGAPAPFRVHYDLVGQWPDGFHAPVTVTTRDPLPSWSIGFTSEDGRQNTRLRNASLRRTAPTSPPPPSTPPTGRPPADGSTSASSPPDTAPTALPSASTSTG